MADVAISALTSASALTTADTIPVLQGGTTKRVTLDLIPVSTAQATAIGLLLVKSNNLSDVPTPATARTNLGLAIGSQVQAYDADLAAIAALTATTDSFLQSKASAWTARTPTQVAADLLAIAPTVVVESTTARTLAAADNGKIIYCTNTGATTITIPTAFSGFACTVVNASTGTTTFAASGTTLTGNLTLNGQLLGAEVVPTGTANTFYILGSTGPLDKSFTLTDAATIASDAAVSNLFTVTLAGNRTLGLPANIVDGQTVRYEVKQDATGSRTLAYNAVWTFPGGAPTASTAANAVDIIIGTYFAGSAKIRAVMTKAYA